MGPGVLQFAGERQVILLAGRVPHVEMAGDLGDVEDGHRDGEGN
jgi:hypothetical protein